MIAFWENIGEIQKKRTRLREKILENLAIPEVACIFAAETKNRRRNQT